MKSIILVSRYMAIFALAMSLVLWSGCRETTDDNGIPNNPPEVPQKEYSPKLVQKWMEFAYTAVRRQGWFALDASRFYAYSSVTAYESMVNALPNNRSLEGQLKDLRNLPKPEAGKTYNWGVVLCHAMPQVMEELMPSMVSESRTSMTALAADQEAEMVSDEELSPQVIADSKEFGTRLAQAIIDWSRTDNRENMQSLVYTPPSNVGNPQYWDGTTLNQTYMMPFWWTSRPMVINSYRLCEPEPPYIYSTDPNSEYYKDVKEVYDASFDPQKVLIGQYWANNPTQSGTPAGSWLGIGNQLVDQFNLDMATTLEMYVRLTVGTRDAFITAWYTKYKWNLERPVSYIRKVMGHTNWSSPVPTPPYPDYLSGTSCNGGISSATLTRMFGARNFEDAQHVDKGYGVRKFSTFTEAGREAFHSRIYGGVHMRRACENGFKHGQCVSEYVYDHMNFKK